MPPVLFQDKSQDPIFKATHAGNIGDAINALLYLKAYWEKTGRKTHLYLQTNVPCVYSVEHPLKNILMNDLMAKTLKPLFLEQPYIDAVTISEQKPDVQWMNLNKFRELPIDYHMGLIQGWQQLCTDIALNPFEPWIKAEKQEKYRDKIVVARVARLRSDYIDYRFLKEYEDKILYVGVPEECLQFKQETAINCEYMTATCFKHLAAIFNSCKLFIGNSGFPFTLAESIKCPRVLETNSICPCVYPLSSNGRIALFQAQFEAFIKEFL